MLLSYNWLKNYINTNLSLEEIVKILTNIGLEVEGINKIEKIKGGLENIYVAKVLECKQHPNADNLKITKVTINDGNEYEVICGAKNVEEGVKVIFANIGAYVLNNKNEAFRINESKIREISSYGMLCSEKEIGIGNDDGGLFIVDNNIEIGTKINTLYPQQIDHQIEIGLTPNRADAMSHYGVARDLYAYLKSNKIEASLNAIDVSEFSEILKNNSNQSPFKIEIEDKLLCKRYAGLYIENVTVKESPEWLKSNLKTIGIEPKNNIVDITNFVLHDIGQPIHAYDSDKIGRNLTVKKATQTQFTLIDKTEKKLTKDNLVIFDNNQPIALAGLMGGLDSAVSENTKNIFLESAYFDSVTIRKSAKSLGLNSDSSFRFERGVDPMLIPVALKKAAILLKKYADGQINYSIIEKIEDDFNNFVFQLRFQKINQTIGQVIDKEKIKEIITLLEIKIISETNEFLEISVPPYRVDITREIDVIEEILRIYGYNAIDIPEKIVSSIIPDVQNFKSQINKSAVNTLVNLGFYEALNNSLVSRKQAINLGLEDEKSVKIINPLSNDLSSMRQSLLGGLLENIAFNLNRQQKNIKLFEFGNVYSLLNYAEKVESSRLAVVISGNINEESWNNKSAASSFFTLKGVLNQLYVGLNLEFTELPTKNTFFSEGLDIYNEKNIKIGSIGKISNQILDFYSIQQPVFYAEINWDLVTENPLKPVKYKSLPKFPKSRRDLALLVDKSVSYNQLYQLAFETDNKLLKSVNLFDVYEGEKLPVNKKSYALSFLLLNEENTLTDEQIEKVISNIVLNYKTKLAAELR
ncbi:MAG: phenylalanine--tRNA ligase subunit beta [Solirubrobacteraceae bacterium]